MVIREAIQSGLAGASPLGAKQTAAVGMDLELVRPLSIRLRRLLLEEN